jgi:CheY-like chemotaxis protein
MTLSDCSQGSPAFQWRVLIVENDPKQRADQVENLRGWGYETFVAEAQTDVEDAYQSLRADAIQKACAYRCHVVLVDQRLRSDASPDDTSGMELAEELAPLHSIILSGYRRPSSLEQAVVCWSYVGKEDGPEALKIAIEATIERIRAQTPLSVSGD